MIQAGIGLTALSLAVSAAPAQQLVLPPDIVPETTLPTAPLVQPVPSAPAMRPLPQLTGQQAALLSQLLGRDSHEQGLRFSGKAPPSPADNDALVRAALDHAHAVRAGRLDPTDFQEDWALRPQPFDPYPGFVRAVQEDRVAQWFANLPPPWAGYEGLRKGLATYRR
ncbi:MAG TPA: murein L,D-transpeptidase, partial [Sphingomonas sp.]|nr:murein L,D-transpeptidase [Sphingomonas sp.]